MRQFRDSYVWSRALRSILWLGVFACLYVFYRRYLKVDYLPQLEPFFDNEGLILFIFLCSEVIIGIIPPELFIIWALRNEKLLEYSALILLLSIISYGAGILGYFIGRYLNTSVYYRFVKRRFLRKLDRRLQQYGIYLIVLAALTPVPFSGVSMLVGSVKFPFRKYVVFALSRFLRFLIYALVLWNV
ncbi:MAG: VTT domain-containing protein [Bacteroidales bacterium]|nr:VTT domain-containing protein [Bacteroidales bacterium]